MKPTSSRGRRESRRRMDGTDPRRWHQREADYGELFDLTGDPGEINNLWDDAAAQMLKARMLQAMVQGIMKSEPCRMARIAGA